MKQESTPGRPGQVVSHVRTPDGRLAVEQMGDLESTSAVIFLHGLTANRRTWKPVAERLGRTHHLLLIDSLARGESDGAPNALFDLESEAVRLAIVLDRLGVRRPILAGHSHGAAVAVAAAARTGARALLLASPVTQAHLRPATLGTLRSSLLRSCLAPAITLFRTPLTRYMLVRRVYTGQRRPPPGAVECYARPWSDTGRARTLPAILRDWDPVELARWSGAPGVPVRVVCGGSDRRVRPDAGEKWASALGADFRLLPGCGHALPEEEPDATAGVLRELLETTRELERGDRQA